MVKSWWFHSIQTVWFKLKASNCIEIQLKSCFHLYSFCSWIHPITDTSECFLWKGFLFFSNFTGIVCQHRFIQNQIENGYTIFEYQMRIRVFFVQNGFFKKFPTKNTSSLSKLAENHSICVKSNGVQWTECLSRFAHTLCWIKQ